MDDIFSGGRRARRRPDMAARAGFGHGQRGEVAAGRDLAAHRVVGKGFDQRHAAVVHGQHHGRAGAVLGNALDDLHRFGQALAQAAHLAGADQAQQAGCRQCIQRGARVACLLVDLRGLGRDDVAHEGFELLQNFHLGSPWACP